ncbi:MULTISPECIES: low molecular weight protein-tyrosine-phosphatase [Rhodomicrobium]|uniref:low molecular weight protein-tyrosine-phosphatase n=1 Tax=Rhodomicrobium TaxID=1068 RepID=UPI000B4C04AF|nr:MULTISPECIES: low molecular weight protein-tyrosine-phosphatase [Rhodomicrobium]
MKQVGASSRQNILFVCLGNICRSPIAEGVFRNIAAQRRLSDRFMLDSAGLGSWHIGHPPDERAQAAMRSRGIDISTLRARRIAAADFERFDLIVAMDRSNREGLRKLAPKDHQHKIKLLMDYAPNLAVQEIPDPFFGDKGAFDYACQLIDAACRGLLVSLTAQAAKDQATPASRPLAPLNG